MTSKAREHHRALRLARVTSQIIHSRYIGFYAADERGLDRSEPEKSFNPELIFRPQWQYKGFEGQDQGSASVSKAHQDHVIESQFKAHSQAVNGKFLVMLLHVMLTGP